MTEINLNRTIYHLLCAYALLLPFEHILDVFFGIDTIFKPYRIVVLALIGVYTLKEIRNLSITREIREDIFLYLIFAYGLLITFFRMGFSYFETKPFYNDLFQMSLYLAAFFIIKNTPLTKEKWLKIFGLFVTGIILNSVYLFNNFYILRNFRRQSGFMDNPNYLSFGLVIAILFILCRLKFKKSTLIQLFQLAIIGLLGTVFIVSGSRTGLAILVVIILLVFWTASLREKFKVIGIGAALTLLILPTNLNKIDVDSPLILLRRIERKKLADDPRFPLWAGAIRATIESDFLGLGIGQFKARFPEFYQDEHQKTIYEVVNWGYHLSTHSDYFGFLVNYGVVGLMLYLFYLFQSVKKVGIQYFLAADPIEKNVYLIALLTLFSLILFGFAAENFISPLFWFLLAVSTKTEFVSEQIPSFKRWANEPKLAHRLNGGATLAQ